MMNSDKLILAMLKNDENGKLTPDNNTELAKLIGTNYEESRSMKDFALAKGLVVKVRETSTDKILLKLTDKGRIEGLNYRKTKAQAPGIQRKAGTSVIRRTGAAPANRVQSAPPTLNTNEKDHFISKFEQLNNAQLAFYHLILANSLGIQSFNYLNFKFLNGVLKISPFSVQQALRELEKLDLIKLEGLDNNIIKPSHSYPLLSELFPAYCKESNSELNSHLKELYFSPLLVEKSDLRSFTGKIAKPSINAANPTPTLKVSDSLETNEEKQSGEGMSGTVLSAGELRHHTTQNHSSMPEVEQAYWNSQQMYPAYLTTGIPPQAFNHMPRPMHSQSPNPYQVKRNPLTILIDGDQQSLRRFMKEAKLDRLRSGDSIYLFSSTGAHSNLSSELIRRIEALKENVYFKRVTSDINRPNTVDQLISTRLTMLLTADFNRDFIILSEDKGFAGAITMLNDTYNLRRGQIQLQTIAIL